MKAIVMPPENITEFRRLQLYYKNHRNSLTHAEPSVSLEAPSTLGMKHLETRAKKKQLIEDRHHEIANDNRKLMEKMTAIMSEGRKEEKPIRIISKTERERRRFAERVNKENQRMAEKLERMPPMVNGKKFEKDFTFHRKLVESIKHKRYSMAATSSIQRTESGALQTQDPWGSTFDADSYISQRLSCSREMTGTSLPSPDPADSDSPIRHMADFRKSVITKKRAPSGPLPSIGGGSGGMSAPIRFEEISGDVRFELSHEPQA